MSRYFSLCSLLVVASSAGAGPPADAGVTDLNALIRTDPPKLESTGKRIPYGAVVVILEEKTVGGKVYAQVRLKHEPKTLFGWTAKTNLGTAKQFDPALAPEDSVDIEKLKDLDATMGRIYNTRGKYLKEQADGLGVSSAGLAAVLKVESGGRPFGDDGRTTIRFENHVFWGQWGKANKDKFDQHFKFDAEESWKGHQWRKGGGEWVKCHENQASEWEVMEFAKTLNQAGALKSASYGAGQVMGFNHKLVGYDTPEEMVKKFDEGIKPQLDAFVAFIKANAKCMKGLKDKNYTLFAEGYNGYGMPAAYGTKIKAAAESYAEVTKGKKSGE